MRPAGMSSDDDSDDFEYDYYSRNDPRKSSLPLAAELTEEEKYILKLEQLYKSVCYGDVDEIENILDGGLDINTRMKDNNTLLLLACMAGTADLAIKLIKRGADVTLDKDSYTPLMAACNCPQITAPYEKSFSIVKYLLEKGASINTRSRKRMTPIMFAASAGNYEAVVALMQSSNKNDDDNQGWTALFWAINDKHLNIVELLLKAGWDPEKSDIRRLKPLHYAKQSGMLKIIELFPDPSIEENLFATYDCVYMFPEEMERCVYFRDVALMLTGMKCQQLIKLFDEKEVDLLSFLYLTRADLITIGVAMPMQQNRILGGLYRFHKHPYKNKSISIVNRDEVYSTVHIANELLVCQRHIITMHGTLKYLRTNLRNWNNEELNRMLEESMVTAYEMNRNVIALKKRIKSWSQANAKADEINRNKIILNYSKWLIIPAVSTVICVVIYKMRSA